MDFDVPTLALAVLSALGLLGGIGMGIKALLERKTLSATAKATQARAGGEDATAASIVAAAARELIDPLRQELAIERAENEADRLRARKNNDEDVARERAKVLMLQQELDQANVGAAALRLTLRTAMQEVELVKDRLAERDRQILVLEREIARYREARVLNEGHRLDSDGEPL